MIESKSKPEDSRFYYQIAVGDWSGDGHDKCLYYDINAAKDNASITEAYAAAKEAHPELDILQHCQDYEDNIITGPVADKIRELDLPEWDEDDMGGDGIYIYPIGWVNYLVWYLNLGDPELDLVLEPQRQHVSYLLAGGYGLFY